MRLGCGKKQDLASERKRTGVQKERVIAGETYTVRYEQRRTGDTGCVAQPRNVLLNGMFRKSYFWGALPFVCFSYTAYLR